MCSLIWNQTSLSVILENFLFNYVHIMYIVCIDKSTLKIYKQKRPVFCLENLFIIVHIFLSKIQSSNSWHSGRCLKSKMYQILFFLSGGMSCNLIELFLRNKYMKPWNIFYQYMVFLLFIWGFSFILSDNIFFPLPRRKSLREFFLMRDIDRQEHGTYIRW